MIIGAILVGILIFFLVLYISENGFNSDVFVGASIAILTIIEICLVSHMIVGSTPTPSALDVYRGNTELEITSVNGTPTDTVVVFKKN